MKQSYLAGPGMNWRDIAKYLIVSTVVVILVTVALRYFCLWRFPSNLPSDLVNTILGSTIQLDGVLFGFSAVMFGFFHGKCATKFREPYIFMMMTVSFLCYFVSIGTSFTLMASQRINGLVVTPTVLAVVGGLLSSVYIVVVLMCDNPKNIK
jgi:hypothetical protein